MSFLSPTVIAIAAVVVHGYEALGIGLRCVHVSVILLQPDLGRDAGVKEAICASAVLEIAAMDNQTNICGIWRQLYPCEPPVFVLTEKRLWFGPFNCLLDVIPEMKSPEVVVVSGGVITVVTVGPEVVDNCVSWAASNGGGSYRIWRAPDCRRDADKQRSEYQG